MSKKRPTVTAGATVVAGASRGPVAVDIPRGQKPANRPKTAKPWRWWPPAPTCLAIVMVPVSAEDERLFSALNFIKSKARSRLQNPHLTDALRLFFSKAFDVLTFPYAEALKAWKEAAAVRGRYKMKFT
ncbi:hypothetical protein FOA52_013079 [Chlamydomonas sp. UWO 241]|nr:hypothetical protein FOA52_013079 [Chlamydomonas sp. UWO 241]